MSPDRPPRGPGAPEEDGQGAPIQELAALRETPASGFVHRIRSRVFRRVLVGQMIDYSWSAPLLVLLEFVKVMFGSFQDSNRDRGEKD